MKFGIVVLSSVLMAGRCSAEAVPMRTVVTTFYPLQIAALNITEGARGVRVLNLAAPAAGCLHDYQLTPRDLTLLDQADVVLVNGAGLESFEGRLRQRCSRIPVIEASAGIGVLQSGGVTNAHIWVSPARHARQVLNLAEGLAAWDPAQAALYRAHARRYADQLESLGARMEQGLKTVARREVVTMHEAFAYFAGDFNLNVVAVIEREPGSEPSAGELAALIRRVKASGVTAVFAEPQYSAKPADLIARETGAGVFVLDPVVSGPVSRTAYLEIMERNFEILKRALDRLTSPP